jgi:hypothetical protein
MVSVYSYEIDGKIRNISEIHPEKLVIRKNCGLKIWNHRSPTIPTPPKLANYVFVSVCTPCMPSFVLEEVDLFWIHNLRHCVNYYSWMMELFLKIHNASQILWIYGRKYRLHLNQLIIQERGVEENDSLQFLDEISQYTYLPSRLRSLYSHWYNSRMDTLLPVFITEKSIFLSVVFVLLLLSYFLCLFMNGARLFEGTSQRAKRSIYHP